MPSFTHVFKQVDEAMKREAQRETERPFEKDPRQRSAVAPWNDHQYFRDAICAWSELPQHIVWLNDIKHYPDLKAAKRLAGQNVYIVSNESAPCYWRPNKSGYTGCIRKAGIYTFEDAYDFTKHCGPEKKVGYAPAPMLTEIQALDQIAHVLGTHPAGSIEGWGEIQAILLQYHNQSQPCGRSRINGSDNVPTDS